MSGNKNILLSGGDIVYLSAEECVKEFELLGYTHDEAIALVDSAMQPVTIDTSDWDRIVEEFSKLPTVNVISAEDVRKALERYKNEYDV